MPWRPQQPDTRRAPEAHDWRAAGEAWGSHANDWSCLYEHYAIDVLIALFAKLGVGRATRLLDIACGSGLAVRLADAMGATVAGIDASADLVASRANARRPPISASVRCTTCRGPTRRSTPRCRSTAFGAAATSRSTKRSEYCAPAGLIGISFWGQGPPLDIRTFFRIFAVNAPQEHRSSMRHLNDISTPGVAEAMLAASGFSVLERGGRTAVIEWPDAEIAWRAISSLGPAVPALRTNDEAMLKREVLAALEPFRDERGIYRTRSDQQFVIARKP